MTVPKTMKALQLREVGHLDLVELPVPQPGADELLIRTSVAIINQSDLNDIMENPFNLKLPIVLGHEGAGVVAVVGKEVKDFKPGQRVTAHPVIPCKSCENCTRGLSHLCLRLGHLAFDRDGAFAEYFCIRADRVRVVPEGMDIAVACLMESVAVCIEAIERARVTKGDTVLIVGDGQFGIITARLVLGYSPKKVILVGRHDFRMKQVPEAVCIHQKQTEDIQKAILEANDGLGVDAAILCTGRQDAMDICVSSLRARGRVSVFAVITGGQVKVDLFRVLVKELEILGSCNDQGYMDMALKHLLDPKINLGSLVTHRIPFLQWQRGIELVTCGKNEALTVTLVFEKDE